MEISILRSCGRDSEIPGFEPPTNTCVYAAVDGGFIFRRAAAQPLTYFNAAFIPFYVNLQCCQLYESQCGIFLNFLSLRFYVKSILEIVEVQNLPFNTFKDSEL